MGQETMFRATGRRWPPQVRVMFRIRFRSQERLIVPLIPARVNAKTAVSAMDTAAGGLRC